MWWARKRHKKVVVVVDIRNNILISIIIIVVKISSNSYSINNRYNNMFNRSSNSINWWIKTIKIKSSSINNNLIAIIVGTIIITKETIKIPIINLKTISSSNSNRTKWHLISTMIIRNSSSRYNKLNLDNNKFNFNNFNSSNNSSREYSINNSSNNY